MIPIKDNVDRHKLFEIRDILIENGFKYFHTSVDNSVVRGMTDSYSIVDTPVGSCRLCVYIGDFISEPEVSFRLYVDEVCVYVHTLRLNNYFKDFRTYVDILLKEVEINTRELKRDYKINNLLNESN